MFVLGEVLLFGVQGFLIVWVEIDDIILVCVFVLVCLFVVGLFEGLVVLLNGEGIWFEMIIGDVMFEDGLFIIGDSQVMGSFLGVIVVGMIDFEGCSVVIDGNLVLFYVVNFFFG